MKNLSLIFTLILSSVAVGQEEITEPVQTIDTIQKDESYIYDVADESPDFPGGRDQLIKFLQTNIHYPAVALKKKISGKCYLKFVVSKTGEISNIRVMKGVSDCPECDDEATRVIGIMPKWTPALVANKPVNCYYTIPIVFSVQ